MIEQDFRIYLITDRAQTGGRPLEKIVEAAFEGGVRALQVREKDLTSRQLFELSLSLRKITHRYKAQLIINDRVDIALLAGADGVHVGRQSIDVKVLRTFVPEPFIIGVSTHSLTEACEAEQGGADFITFGPVYETPSKMKYGPPPGVGALKEVCRKVNLPVLALGGINKKEKIKDIKESGAFGIALISGLFQAEDVRAQAFDFINELEKYNDTY